MKTLFVTEQQKYLSYRSVIFRVAQSLGIKNLQRKSNHELFCEIQNSQSALIDYMYSYFVAYNNWFEHKKSVQGIRKRTRKELADSASPLLEKLDKLRLNALRKFEQECELLEA